MSRGIGKEGSLPDVAVFDAATVPLHGRRDVEASAGTGKTESITRVVLRLVVERGLALDELLIVTFTEAAASDLRRRVRRQLAQAARALEELEHRGRASLEGELAGGALDDARRAFVDVALLLADVLDRCSLEPLEARARIELALRDADDAAIFTIHGFCQRAALECASFMPSLPGAVLVTDTAALVLETTLDFWAREAEALHPLLADELARRGIKPSSVVSFVRRAVASRDAPLLPVLAKLPPLDGAAVLEAFARMAKTWDEGEAKRVAGTIGGHGYRKDRVASWCAKIAAFVTTTPEGDLRAIRGRVPERLDRFTWSKLASEGATLAPGAEPFAACEAFLAAVEALDRALALHVVEFKQRLVAEARTRLRARMERLGVRGFDDLVYDLRDALRGPAGTLLAERLRRRFRAALIDEFQDTDPAQWEIFDRVWPLVPGDAAGSAAESRLGEGEPLLALIGDPKQAIYGFRGADVFAYLDAKGSVPEGHGYTMSRNYRSDPGLVRATECVFMGPTARLLPSAARPSPFLVPGIGFPLVDARPGATNAVTSAAESPIAPLRLAAARKLHATKELLTEAILDDLAADVTQLLAADLEHGAPRVMLDGRPVLPSDIAVLTRTNAQAALVQARLAPLGVPSVVTGDQSVFAKDEAYGVDDAGDLLLVLEALLAPGRPRALRGALITALIGVTAAELVRMDELDGARLEARARDFTELAQLWHQRGFVQMASAFARRFEVPARLMARPDGERRMTNFAHLVELLHVAETTLHLGPRALVAWLVARRRDEASRPDEEQLRLESDESAVIVTTVHKSKGLDYPIVYCPFLWDGAIRKATELFVHGANRLEIHMLSGGADDGARAQWAIERHERESLAEDVRLAYVALTRAKHRTVLAWGMTKQRELSALDCLLFGRDVAAPMSPAEPMSSAAPTNATVDSLRVHVKALDEAGISARLEELEAASGGAIACTNLARGAALVDLSASVPLAPTLAARRFSRGLVASHVLASFTRLVAPGATPLPMADVGRDRDEAVAGRAAAEASAARAVEGALTGPCLLGDFPRGARAGTFFHELFEHAEFSSHAATLERLAGERLVRHGYPASLAPTVAAAAEEIFATPFAIGAVPGSSGTLRLADIARADRLDELEFHMPIRRHLASRARGSEAQLDGGAGGGRRGVRTQERIKAPREHAQLGLAFDVGLLSPKALARIFAEHPSEALEPGYAGRVERLGFAPLEGFLKGYVDLVFRHRGRYYLADYKTNHLGESLASYATARLPEAMSHGHYYLQYHLYVLALHRHLSQRLRGYDYEEHFGGVHYLFVKGMTESSGPAAGSFFEKPPLARIEALSQLFGALQGSNAEGVHRG